MISYALDSDNDLFLLNGDIAVIIAAPEAGQDIKTKLQTFQGEYFINTTFGVPYYQTIFQKPANIGIFDTAIRSMILSSPEVAKITKYQSAINSFKREYTVTFTVTLLDGGTATFTNNFSPQL
jgi:hypothetical protein